MEEPAGGEWTEERVAALEQQFGSALADELLALGYLVDHLQWEGFPWLVSASARDEIDHFRGRRQPGIFKGWTRISDAQEDWTIDSFCGVAPSILVPTALTRINPLILRGLGVSSVDEIVAEGGPLGVLRDLGDRALVRDALLSGVPSILTTDLRSFWAHRSGFFDYGLEIWRPSDALLAYESKWAADRDVLERRRGAL